MATSLSYHITTRNTYLHYDWCCRVCMAWAHACEYGVSLSVELRYKDVDYTGPTVHSLSYQLGIRIRITTGVAGFVWPGHMLVSMA